MTAKDKATEIFNKHYSRISDILEGMTDDYHIRFIAKVESLAEVSGILQANPTRRTILGNYIDNTMYWIGVQQELEQL